MILFGAWILAGVAAHAAPPLPSLELDQPRNWQVIQQRGDHTADIPVEARLPQSLRADEVELSVLDESGAVVRKLKLPMVFPDRLHTRIKAPAGGWYSLRVRLLSGGVPVASPEKIVSRVGVGEVFVTAGQSNSVNSGDPFPLSPERVSTFNPWTGEWGPGQDPMAICTGSGGSVWPYFGQLISERFHVPVAIVAVGCGGTSLEQWQPGAKSVPICAGPQNGNLYLRLKFALKRLSAMGGIRAILWHQGESNTTKGTWKWFYYWRFRKLVNSLNEDAPAPGGRWTWFVAKASYFPEVRIGTPPTDCDRLPPLTHDRLKSMERIRNAQQEIWERGLAHPGPDTDQWIGNLYRSPQQYCVHFNVNGLKTHAEGWARSVTDSGLIQ